MKEQGGFPDESQVLWRFARQLDTSRLDVTVRAEGDPSAEVQIEFGSDGRMSDPISHAVRKARAFVARCLGRCQPATELTVLKCARGLLAGLRAADFGR